MKRIVTEFDNLNFINSLGFVVENYEESVVTVPEFNISEVHSKMTLRKFGGERSLYVTQVYDDFSCDFFYLKETKTKNGKTIKRMKTFNATEEFREFMSSYKGEDYLDKLDALAKEEKKDAIENAEQALKKRVCDREVVCAILRNRLAVASEKQIFVKLQRAKKNVQIEA